VAPLLRERAVPNTHDSATVFNDLNLAHFDIGHDLRRAIREEGTRRPPPPSTVDGEHAVAAVAAAAALIVPSPASSAAAGSLSPGLIAASASAAGCTTVSPRTRQRFLPVLNRPPPYQHAPPNTATGATAAAGADTEIITAQVTRTRTVQGDQ